MFNASGNLSEKITVDSDNLYREESYTDLKMATIKRLVPVDRDGNDDPGRETIYIGQTQLLTQAGLLPVQGEIAAASLPDAIAKFPEAIDQAVERMVEEAREIQRQQASQIVVPGTDDIKKIIT
ncbi:MAG: hypothetical protein JRJ56_00160 [Deltaproteobacteria bacterium]|nr:hypothetical protein [Deltaproteobacteria bacterium]